jgi:hypothetical protein
MDPFSQLLSCARLVSDRGNGVETIVSFVPRSHNLIQGNGDLVESLAMLDLVDENIGDRRFVMDTRFRPPLITCGDVQRFFLRRCDPADLRSLLQRYDFAVWRSDLMLR